MFKFGKISILKMSNFTDKYQFWQVNMVFRRKLNEHLVFPHWLALLILIYNNNNDNREY